MLPELRPAAWKPLSRPGDLSCRGKEVIASWWKQKVSGLVPSPPRQPTRHNLPSLELERIHLIGRDGELDTLG